MLYVKPKDPKISWDNYFRKIELKKKMDQWGITQRDLIAHFNYDKSWLSLVLKPNSMREIPAEITDEIQRRISIKMNPPKKIWKHGKLVEV